MAIVNSVKWYLTVVLICISLMACHTEHHIICLGPSVCPSWKSISSSPLSIFLKNYLFIFIQLQLLSPFFNWVVCFPGVKLCEFFIYFGDQTLVKWIFGKYIFPYAWLFFHFANVLCTHSEAYKEFFESMERYLHYDSKWSVRLASVMNNSDVIWPQIFPNMYKAAGIKHTWTFTGFLLEIMADIYIFLLSADLHFF